MQAQDISVMLNTAQTLLIVLTYYAQKKVSRGESAV